MLYVGIFEAIIYWILFLPYMLFTYPIKRFNQVLNSKKPENSREF